MEKWTHRCEYVRCGKPACKSCPHGPYWYGYRHEKGRMRKKYFGKQDPRPVEPATGKGAKLHPFDTILNRQTATVAIACAILGISSTASQPTALQAFRRKSLETHPDRGGDAKDFARVNAAWSYLKAFNRW